MRPITVYEANDGSRWDNETDAVQRDVLVAECDRFASFLRPVPKGTAFSNGHGYVQQPKGSRERLLAFLKSKGASRDSDGPVGKLMYRMWRIDEQDREWGQTYFANNPHEAESQEPVTASAPGDEQR